MKTIKMFGPSISNPDRVVNRDVPEVDVQAYRAAGYKEGSISTQPEMVVAVKKTDEIPDSFPGHASLLEAKIVTFADLDAVEEWTEIPGIGDATAKKMAEARKSVTE